MVMQMLEYRASNPNRPPDWRWQFGKWLAESGTNLKRIRADRYVGLAARFAGQLANCYTIEEQVKLLDNYPSLFEAWSIYSDSKARSLRWVIEARLLAGQLAEEIAALSSPRMTTEIVSFYEIMFFSVLEDLERPDHISQVVFTEAAHRGLDASRQYDLIWKMMAYFGGPHVLDLLIHKAVRAPSKATNPQSAQAWLADDIRNQQLLKAAIAIRAMPVGWQTQAEIMNLYYRVLDMDRQSEGGGSTGNESFQVGIQNFLSAVPWASGLTCKSSNAAIAKADAQPQSLRVSELLSIGAGEIPAGLEELMASAKFPDELHASAVSTATANADSVDTKM